VLVYAGTYTQQVTLKSGVMLWSNDGPVSTTITADQGPIVSASGVLSASIQGFTIKNQGTISEAVGIDTIDSDILVSNCVIGRLQGELGQETYGIRANGGTLVITGTVIQHIYGGDCDQRGGTAFDIHTDDTSLTVNDSELRDIWGGRGCCVILPKGTVAFLSGDTTGIWATGGDLALNRSLFTDLGGWEACDHTVQIYGIRTSSTSGSYLRGNAIAGFGPARQRDCWYWGYLNPSYISVAAVAVLSLDDAVLYMANNAVEGMSAASRPATAIEAQNTNHVSLTRNSIISIRGGATATSYGIRVGQADTAEISANVLEDLRGGRGVSTWSRGGNGGDVVGIQLTGITATRVVNNVIWSLRGGWGGESARRGGDGGDAFAVSIAGGQAIVQNNTLYHTAGGLGGGGEPYDPVRGLPGASAGLRVTDDAQVLAINKPSLLM